MWDAFLTFCDEVAAFIGICGLAAIGAVFGLALGVAIVVVGALVK